jgi:hypothetical protein
MIQLPVFTQVKLGEAPFAPKWKGADAHIGYFEDDDTLINTLAMGKTTCGTVSLMAGVMLWGARRLESFYDVQFCFEMVDAAFAWQFDWRYFDGSAEPYRAAPDQPPVESATFVLDDLLRGPLTGESVFYSFDQPATSLAEMANVVHYILPKSARPIYEAWFTKVCRRLNRLALAPDISLPNFADFESRQAYRDFCAPMRGLPLPPIVLDDTADLDTLDLYTEASRFIERLDYKNNRFLRSPEEMKKLGFEGTPYRVNPI